MEMTVCNMIHHSIQYPSYPRYEGVVRHQAA